MTPARFPHSDTPGSTLGCQLPRAYRRLLRPSSALDAKASTMCPSQLVTHTTNPTPPQPTNQSINQSINRGETPQTSPGGTRLTAHTHHPPTQHMHNTCRYMSRGGVTRHKRTSTHRDNHPGMATKQKETHHNHTPSPPRPPNN